MPKNRLFSSTTRHAFRVAQLGVAAVFAGLVAAPVARGASASWNASPTDGNWVANSSETNWATGAGTYPGSTTVLNNTDTATFLTSSTTTINVNSSTLDIGSIAFGNSSVTKPSSFTISSTSGYSLLLSSGGAISISSSVVAPTSGTTTETISTPLVLEPASASTAGTYSFSNAATSKSNVLVIGGGVSGGTTSQGVTLTLTGANAGTSAVSGNITDGGAALGMAVTKTSTGTWTLSGTGNTFSGGLSVTGGELDVSTDANLGAVPTAATGDITINGGRLAVTASTTINAFRTILLGANPTGGNTTGTFSTSGSTTTVVYNGSFQDVNASTMGDFVKQGGGTLQLGGASTYSGSTFLNNGITQLTTGNNRLPTGTTVNVGQGASTNVGTFDLNGQSQQIAGLNSVAGTSTSTTAKNTVTTTTGTSTLTLGGSGTYAYGVGTAANSGIITGALSINKTGTGTQTFGDANTYTGSTTVGAGTLVAGTSTTPSAKALGGTSGVFVNGGGTLQMGAANQFNATAPAPLTLGGATVAATFSVNGNSQGSTTAIGVGALTLAAASTNNVVDFNSKNGVVAFAGLTTNGAALTVNNYLNNGGASGGPDELIFNQDETSNLGNIVFAGYGSSSEAALGGGFFEVFPTAVPEPATVFGGMLLVGVLGWSQRRRLRGLGLAARAAR